MTEILALMIILGITNAAIIDVLVYKWGVLDRVKPKTKIQEAFLDCDFCKAFWMAFFQVGIIALAHWDPQLLLIPLGSAFISSKML